MELSPDLFFGILEKLPSEVFAVQRAQKLLLLILEALRVKPAKYERWLLAHNLPLPSMLPDDEDPDDAPHLHQ